MLNRSWAGYRFPMALWDLWLDYHRRDADGLTHGNVRNARPGVTLTAGAYIIVGNEEADSAVAEVVRIDDDGVVLVARRCRERSRTIGRSCTRCRVVAEASAPSGASIRPCELRHSVRAVLLHPVDP